MRRSSRTSGVIAFPIDDPKYRNTMEGGMIVKLVAREPDGLADEHVFRNCCGSHVFDSYGELLLWDDLRPHPERSVSSDYANVDEWLLAMDQEEKTYKDWLHYHVSECRTFCGPYLASIALGSTGWSGWTDEGGGHYFRCTFDDLMEPGKLLYRQLQYVFPYADLHLLTFLDT